MIARDPVVTVSVSVALRLADAETKQECSMIKIATGLIIAAAVAFAALPASAAMMHMKPMKHHKKHHAMHKMMHKM